MIIAFAIVINLIPRYCWRIATAALGPIRCNPALAGGVVLTTITDVVGFFAFLGLAAYFWLNRHV